MLNTVLIYFNINALTLVTWQTNVALMIRTITNLNTVSLETVKQLFLQNNIKQDYCVYNHCLLLVSLGCIKSWNYDKKIVLMQKGLGWGGRGLARKAYRGTL